MSLERCRRICPECGYGMCLSSNHSMLPCVCGHTRLKHLKQPFHLYYGAPPITHPHPCQEKDCECETYAAPAVEDLLADMQDLDDELGDMEMPDAA